MKKLIAILAAAALMFTAVGALAFTGFNSDPGTPVVYDVEDSLFDVSVRRVANDPEVDETPWGEQIYTWIYMEDDAPIDAGDDVTFACEYSIPEAIDGISAEDMASIEIVFHFYGPDGIEIIDATGLEANYECDYDAGYCYPLPGYGNASVSANTLTVDAVAGTNVQVVVRGMALEGNVSCECEVVVGQYRIPTHFSVGKVVRVDGGYYAFVKDLFNVQIRGMKFFAENGVFTGYYVCLNDHDYIRSADGSSFTSVEDPTVVYTEGVRFEALTLAYNTFMGFFGFTDDGVNDVLTDGVMLAGSEPVRFRTHYEFGGEAPVEPTDPPAEPTEPPVQPTEPPTDPTPVNPPTTGAVSLAFAGVAAVLAGAGIVLFRKKK